MSSDRKTSSTDKFAANIGSVYSSHVDLHLQEDGISRQAVNLVTHLSISIESKLPVTELDINPETSPQLESIKVETSRLPDDTFQAFIALLQVVESHHSNLAGYRSKVQNNKPLPAGVFEKQQASLKMGGIKIIGQLHQAISQHVGFVEKASDDVNSKIRDVFDQSEHIQRQQRRLTVLKDEIVPPLSAVHPALAPVESVVKVATALTAHEASCNLNEQLTALAIMDKALREDLQVATQTKTKLEKYRHANELAREDWIYACKTIYRIEELDEGSCAEVTKMLQRINLADEKMLEIISPIKQYLVRTNEYYGQGITVIREVESFCDVVPKIIQDIKRIFSAKEIIKTSHEAMFGKTVYGLGLVIFEYLQSMRSIFCQSPIDPVKQAQFYQVQTHKFSGDTRVLIHILCEILDNHTSSSKSKKAEDKRMAGDRCNNSLSWKTRRLVKSSEVRVILRRVENAVEVIHKMSASASMGKMVKSIGGDGNEVERAYVKFDASNDSLSRLHQVLAEDVEEGLKLLKELLIEEAPKSHMRQVWERLRFHREKC